MGPIHPSWSRFLLPFSALLVVVIAIALFTHQSAVVAQLNEWKLFPQAESFTELFLNNHLDLPKQVEKGQTVQFSFTIHNLEGKTMTYPYVVYLKTDGGYRIPIARNSVTLAHKESRLIKESYTFKNPKQKVTVFIELSGMSQNLHFRLPSAM
ncbi:MAG: DUF1616 domain-containing protein [bacterium]|nr:DUF1616 domain-containing protein [bacterium]